MAITPLNQLDIYRIVHDFDRDHFKIAKPLRDDQAGRVIVIIQLERMMGSFGIPTEIIDDIMRRCLKDSPSVGALLMCYKNTPAIVMLHPLPLSYNTNYLNTASQSLLVRLKLTPANGELASYQQLMALVFTHHFKKLTLDQKLQLIQRSNITPWEQKSPSQKLELLGRIQAPTLWGQAKVSLQLLLWKIQFAAPALALDIVKLAGLAMYGYMTAVVIPIVIAKAFPSIAGTAIYQILQKGWRINALCLIISSFVTLVVCPVIAGLGLDLQIRILPKSVKKTGAWIQSSSWRCFLIPFTLFRNYHEHLHEARQKLHYSLLQSLNTANITIEQDAFANAHLLDLINQWLNLTLPSDINTGSLQIDTQEFKRLA